MRRKVFKFAALLSLLLCATTLVLWTVSYRSYMDSPASWTSSTRQHSIWFRRGLLYYGSHPRGVKVSPQNYGWSGDAWLIVRTIPYPPSRRGVLIVLRYRTLAILFALTAAAMLSLRGRRMGDGRCEKCGYDLTGNVSGVCPECGAQSSMTHHIIIGNDVGPVYSGDDERAARRTYLEYLKQSHSGIGRVAGASVTWECEGEVYLGTRCESRE